MGGEPKNHSWESEPQANIEISMQTYQGGPIHLKQNLKWSQVSNVPKCLAETNTNPI